MYVSRSIAIAAAASALFVAPLASAQSVQVQVQGQYQPQQPVYVQQAPPPPPNAVAPDGQYVAPMQQQTQQTYVPQSVAMSGPRVIRVWHEGDPIPPGYHPATRVRTGLIAGGAAMFGAPYLISILIAAGGDTVQNPCCNALWIPVLGPFIQMGGFASGTNGGVIAFADIGLVVDGVLQAAGAAMFIYGLAVPKMVLVRNDLGALKNVTVAPIVTKDMSGMGIRANF